MVYAVSIIIIYIMVQSIYTYLLNREEIRGTFSLDHFCVLIHIYFIVMIGFGLLYFLLSQKGIVLLDGRHLQDLPQLQRLGIAIYFSGVTLMTVGYGDITPIGIGKAIALIEAMIGYLLPAAFFVQVMKGVKGKS
ncbi:potassium channel LctB [Melghiribacillus thermohalophilus]|uniref:Potassium channel LctB n=1 Tax=Melghiribacillus thermohalophilus TaxID=1324956 RepID=A0A4R3MPZ2_9BACI|nr:potassium channel family protein [Melghiribacillus thermohalophilus]TCT17935.1 potassium channel LctB [Melghiribacillus thermohalophilus]